jgi:PAS domain S-box-containing protein
LLINLPASIANPIRELTESIRQIELKNYTERVHFESHSEFGDLARSFNSMAKKLLEYNNSNLATIMMEKKRIETLINSMLDPVIGLDENLKIIFLNEQALNVIGERQESVIGKSARELALHNDLIRSLVKDISPPYLDEKKDKLTPVKIFANGKEGYFEKHTHHISIIPTGEEIQKIVGHVIILRNVTEYKELDFAKTNFIATVSHEFKTPISSIQMSLQLLENEKLGKLNTEQKNLANSMGEDVNRLLKITGELLNMTQVESGNIQLAIKPADPKEIVNIAVNTSRTQAENKNIELKINFGDKLPLVHADKEKSSWVLTNLIVNAIHYSFENSQVDLDVNQEGGKVFFSVKDRGQGIPANYKIKIFDRYFRVPGTDTEGTGLGLSICKEFIEAQGGQVSVQSEYGYGSTFSFSLNAVS